MIAGIVYADVVECTLHFSARAAILELADGIVIFTDHAVRQRLTAAQAIGLSVVIARWDIVFAVFCFFDGRISA